MSSVYLTTVTNEQTGEPLALAYGDFGVMNYVAKDALKKMTGQSGSFAARIIEVENLGEETEKRTLVQVTGDADVVTYVVKKKIASERKELDAASETDNADTDGADAEALETV